MRARYNRPGAHDRLWVRITETLYRALQALGVHDRDACTTETREQQTCTMTKKKKKTPSNWDVTVNIPFYNDLLSQVHFIIFAPTFIDNS